MSFILEALKKSARDREKGTIPTLETDHRLDCDLHFSQAQPSIFKRIFLPVMLLCLCILLVFIGKRVFFSTTQLTVFPLPSPHTDQSSVDPSTEGVMENQMESPSSLIPQHNKIPSIDSHIPTTTNRPVTEKGHIPFLSKLPQSIRKQLPPLHFAGHVYSEDPARRMIMINNTIVREQESIQGVLLQSITMDGVILEFHSHVFRKILFQQPESILPGSAGLD